MPREQRIAKTLANVVSSLIPPTIGDPAALRFTMNEEFFLDIALGLEPYARKDFAVRYGHLEDGNAKA